MTGATNNPSFSFTVFIWAKMILKMMLYLLRRYGGRRVSQNAPAMAITLGAICAIKEWEEGNGASASSPLLVPEPPALSPALRHCCRC